MTKPLAITSPLHAMAVATYSVLGILGVLYIFGVGNNGSLENRFGEGIADIWSTVLTLSAFGSLGAAISAKFSEKPESSLKAEMFCSLALGLTLGFYVGVLFSTFGSRAIATAIFGSSFALGALLRAVQIFREQRLIKKARLHPVKSDPVLADPRDDHDN